MKRHIVLAVMLLAVLMVHCDALAQDAHRDRIIELKESRLEKIHEWEREATIALTLVILVGVMSAVIAFVQKFQFKANKVLTAVLGLIIAVITIIDANLYHDRGVLDKTITKARRIMEDVDDELAKTVRPEDEPVWREGIRDKLKEILKIEEELLAVRGDISLDLVPTAYAQSRVPSWVTNPPSDKSHLYFIGEARDVSLAAAKELSLADARGAAVDYLVAQLQKVQGIASTSIDLEGLSESLIKSAEVSRTYYDLDKADGRYRYSTLLKLARSFVEVDLTFFAIEKGINEPDTKQILQNLQTTPSPREAYYNQREETYRKLLETAESVLSPADNEKFLRARQDRKSGNNADALPTLKEIIRKYPTFFLGWYNLGLTYDAMNDSANAANAYGKAVQLEPAQAVRDASVYNTYGHFFLRRANYLEAKRLFEAALRVNPEHALAKNNLRVVQNLLERAP